MAPTSEVSVEADLRLEISGGLGTTTAHLTGRDQDLVLDVSDPAVLVRQLSSASGSVVPQPLRGRRVRVVSGGRDLGRVRTTASGRVLVWPTPAGVRYVASALGRTRSVMAPAGGLLVVVLGILVARRHRRDGRA